MPRPPWIGLQRRIMMALLPIIARMSRRARYERLRPAVGKTCTTRVCGVRPPRADRPGGAPNRPRRRSAREPPSVAEVTHRAIPRAGRDEARPSRSWRRRRREPYAQRCRRGRDRLFAMEASVCPLRSSGAQPPRYRTRTPRCENVTPEGRARARPCVVHAAHRDFTYYDRGTPMPLPHCGDRPRRKGDLYVVRNESRKS